MKKILALVLCSAMLFTACSSGKETLKEVEPDTKETAEVPEEEKEPEVDLTGLAVNPLTGLYIDEDAAARRTVSVVINNLPKALPQSGIGQADIYYEVLAEGGITRMVVLFQDFDAEKIGPVRSARDYFTYFALDNDAIFVHHGGSPTGYAAIRNRGIADIDGMSCGAFWRDKDRVNKPGMYEHSSYIDAEGILESAGNYGLRMTREGEPMFTFSEEERTPIGDDVTALTLKYSGDQISRFEYDAEEGVYYRYQNGSAHIDDLTGETISVKNVIVQYANTYVIAGDDAGRREVELVGSGTGYYYTNGKYENITWTKTAYNSPTKWYGADGKELKLNKGKTFICVYPSGFEVATEGSTAAE